ncbi:MFS transporter [Actinomadura viridis]|uniref:EmrB/QacA subfamily drug resistance transporter n=1 Tax=Actinomadura viridis TaxID=58110 RepID=A0A931GRB1_9ACTN|nr:MFS transporter [Actinomadura viridis]MBG6089479.1 EmrB/QacA subfamily drug resistance transporter [Actinomadura viridis]
MAVRGGGPAGPVVVALACAAQFMVVLDISVVNVALPSIRQALGFGAAGPQWVVNGYALAFAGFLLLGGRLADLYGLRRVFAAGLALFSAASLVGGLATTPGVLVAARAAQGLGAAVLAPATLTLLTTTFPEGPGRTRALAAWTSVGLAGGTAGNLIGGALTEFLSWRWILLVNVPLGAVALPLAMAFLSTGGGRVRGGRRLDVAGAVTVTSGLMLLTFGVTQVRGRGWDDAVTVCALGGAVLALAAFVLVETRPAAAPLMPLRLLRPRSIWAGNLVLLLAGACLNPMWFFLTFYMQDGLGYGGLRTGLGFLPHTVVTIAVGLRLTPWLMERVDARVLIGAGALVSAAGFAWQARAVPEGGYLPGVLVPAVLISAGAGLLNGPAAVAVTRGVAPGDAGAASGLMNTAKQVGGALGLAVLSTLAAAGAVGASGASGAEGSLAGSFDHGRAFLAMAAVMVAVAALAATLPSAANERTGAHRPE